MAKEHGVLDDPQALMGSLLMFGAIASAVYAIVFIRLPAGRTHSWPSVPGTVTHAGVAKKAGTTGWGNPNTFYEADVRYQYSVNGREYRGTTLRLGGSLALSVPGRAREVADRYREGDEVDVYYNPAKPRQACLEQGEEVSTFIIAIAIGFFAVGWLL